MPYLCGTFFTLKLYRYIYSLKGFMLIIKQPKWQNMSYLTPDTILLMFFLVCGILNKLNLFCKRKLPVLRDFGFNFELISTLARDVFK